MAGWPTWSMGVAGMLLVWGVHTSANAGSCVGAKPEVEGGTHGVAMMQRDVQQQKAVIAEETIGTGADSPDVVEVNGLFIKKEVLANMVASQVAAAIPDPPPFADEEIGTLLGWKRRCQRVPEGTIMLKLTMGDFVDYFKPTGRHSLCDMLTSHNKHQWSSDGITWVQPDYSTGHLGGSAKNWPKDGREYLSIWGSTIPENHGWCCSNKRDGPTSFHQIGTMEALQEPPVAAAP
eukprot:CAMPEP_0172671038 /NCGR_PEP_ID=MMETSP1074-20121228/10661_1 /TAXON_ID=2916 /ORGANISM="Ceratium fusus, Strain PA161109" /LENGTH=233 /DNA_ID=CAMNT_0013488023 /DNA_START=38 /DNA_END=739 /DNA_ORIENTATION=+